MALGNRRSVMTLYCGTDSDSTSIHCNSHKVRIVLAEKDVPVEIKRVDSRKPPAELLKLHPCGSLPTLIDRGDLVLYHPSIIIEYLDERFPHPPLLPVYPVARAECRRMMHHIEQDWYGKLDIIHSGKKEEAKTARNAMIASFVALAPLFKRTPYLLNDEFSLVDCCVAPLIWRFSMLGIELPRAARSVIHYAERIFNRDSFQLSLTDTERELRAA